MRFGIIGFGNFAERAIMPAIRATPDAELVAIQKRDRTVAAAKAHEHGVRHAFSSAEELARHADVDAVFIVSANGAHCEETVAAARAGKHVLVEKPMAVSSAEAETMIGICAANAVTLMVGHMIRFSPLVRRMRTLVRAGAIGRIVGARADFIYDARLSRRDWLMSRPVAGGGPVFDIGVHCLDTLRYVLDDEVTSVHATLDPLPDATTVESSAQISLRFSRGALGAIFCSYAAPTRRKAIEIIGTEGILSAPDFTVGSITVPLTLQLGTDAAPGPVSVEEHAIPNLYIEEITHFMGCVDGRELPETPGENGLANQRVLDAIMRGSA